MISIFSDLEEKNRNLVESKDNCELKLVSFEINKVFGQIKEQFEDHLETINENTNEIHSNFEYLCELDKKIDKLSERIDELNNTIKQQNGEKVEKKTFKLQPLTTKEKEVFYALYILTEHKRYATYKEIAKRVSYSEDLVASYITNLIEKGIPIVKKYANRLAYLGLNSEFREIQAKENIVGVNTLLTHWMR